MAIGECFDVRPLLWANVCESRLVEHFSPYCPHCRAFSPTWDTLVDDYDGSRINLAQVDCVVNGGTSIFISRSSVPLSKMPTDLCNKNGVTGYPEMKLYHDGALQATFEGVREYERIIHFIEEHTGVSKPSDSAALSELPESDLQTSHDELNPHGEVLALTPETFAGVVAGGNVFVKFFAPWWVFHLLRENPNGR